MRKLKPLLHFSLRADCSVCETNARWALGLAVLCLHGLVFRGRLLDSWNMEIVMEHLEATCWLQRAVMHFLFYFFFVFGLRICDTASDRGGTHIRRRKCSTDPLFLLYLIQFPAALRSLTPKQNCCLSGFFSFFSIISINCGFFFFFFTVRAGIASHLIRTPNCLASNAVWGPPAWNLAERTDGWMCRKNAAFLPAEPYQMQVLGSSGSLMDAAFSGTKKSISAFSLPPARHTPLIKIRNRL